MGNGIVSYRVTIGLFYHKISMVSLAFQKEIEPVRAYVKDHNMTWYNGIVEGVPKTINPKAEIIKNLRIKVYLKKLKVFSIWR